VTAENGSEKDAGQQRDGGREKGDCVSCDAAFESERWAQRGSGRRLAKRAGELGETVGILVRE